MTIESVRLGPGLAGSRVAVIDAPPDAPPGSMVALTQFLNAQPGIRASAGYAGEERDHVLRVSGVQDQTRFKTLLQEQFPVWQARLQGMDVPTIEFSPTLKISQMDAPDTLAKNTITRFMRNNADMLTGLSYSAGNLALLLSSRGKKGAAGRAALKDPYRGASAAAYMISSTMLIIFAKNPENARDIYAILEDTYPEVRNADAKTKDQVKKLVDDTWKFTRNYTWEITSAITGFGAAMQMVSAKKTGNKIEMLATVGTLSAMAIATLIPEKGGRSILDGLKFGGRNDVLTTQDLLEEQNIDVEKLSKHSNALSNRLRENPLGISAAIQAVSNITYGAATFARGGRDWALAAVSGTSLIGNVFQSFATKGRGYVVDDVVSAAADVMMADPYLAKDDPTELHAYAMKLAKALSREPEIVQRPEQLSPAIERRVLQRQTNRPSGLAAYTQRERPTMAQSPFLSARHTMQLADKAHMSVAMG